MNKKGLKLALAALLAVSQAYASSEMRTPWIAGSGPLRYVFENSEQDGKYNLNTWSAAHSKYANRAFLKHGVKTQELSALIFNQAEFVMSDAFFNAQPDSSDPLASLKSLTPRAEYNEMGMTVGGEISMPVWKNKGLLGLRATVPFRSVEMERLDSGLDKTESPDADYVASKVIKVNYTQNGGVAGNDAVLAKAYRLDLLQQLTDADGNKILTPSFGGGLSLLGNSISTVANNLVQVVANSYVGFVPAVNPANPVQPEAYGFMLGSSAPFPMRNGNYFIASPPLYQLNLANAIPSKQIHFVDSSASYDASLNALTPAQAKQSWLVFRRTSDSTDPGKFVGAGRVAFDTLENYIKQYEDNAFVYLSKQGVSLDGQQRTGLGDIDLEVFYKHALHEDWDAELNLGLRLPTGGDKDKFGSPYKAMLGNGGHFELKVGGVLAWEALSWMNLKADASYHFVLEAKENRMAVFAGSTVKNLGPKAAADVDWGYFVGRMDATFFHPKTRDIRSVLGYELYYKLEDRLSYKNATAVAFDGVARALDKKLAVKNTESIAHKARFETSYQVSNYFELFAGGSFTFAGQNAMRDRDTHGGFNIRF